MPDGKAEEMDDDDETDDEGQGKCRHCFGSYNVSLGSSHNCLKLLILIMFLLFLYMQLSHR